MIRSLMVGVLAVTCGLQAAPKEKWVAVWTASVHGPYPAGNAVAQPELGQVLPGNAAEDQTLRMVFKPALWSHRVRLRFSNVFGAKPLSLDGVFVGVHASGGALLPGTNRAVLFGGRGEATVPAGEFLWSDPVELPYAKRPADLASRKMGASFHVAGNSGPMTWHAKAMSTSYLSAPHAGAHGAEESAASLPFTTASWFFVDAVEAMAPADTRVVMGFGDSITDGTNSTLNGDDRWPDFLAQRLGPGFVVVNGGIGGNRVVGPTPYDSTKPFGGGPSALDRLERDVLSLAGIETVIWLEGINDINAGAPAEEIIAGYRTGVAQMKARRLRVIGATVTSALGAGSASGTPAADVKRRAVNEFIRTGGLFDGVADFDAATLDPATGALKAQFQPGSSIGGPGDKLHPNRAGYQAMANAIDLGKLFGPKR